MTAKKKKNTAKEEIDLLIEEWGIVYPGLGKPLSIHDTVTLNLPMVVATFGVIAHTYTCGQVVFSPDQESDIAHVLGILIRLCQSVGITEEEWDRASLTIMGADVIAMVDPEPEFTA